MFAELVWERKREDAKDVGLLISRGFFHRRGDNEERHKTLNDTRREEKKVVKLDDDWDSKL